VVNVVEKEQLFEEIVKALCGLDKERTLELTNQVLENNINPVEAIENGFAKAMEIMGEQFEKRELYIAELAYAASTMEEAMGILEPELLKNKEARGDVHRVILCTVEGDIHSLGKNLIRTMLMTAGFEVIDLGTDVPAHEIVEKVQELNPKVVGLSALMTTTMLNQQKVITALEQNGLRDRVKVIIGGAPVTGKYAQEIGANGFAENAMGAVSLVKSWFV
jgi:trimethylamine corrinoid protein